MRVNGSNFVRSGALSEAQEGTVSTDRRHVDPTGADLTGADLTGDGVSGADAFGADVPVAGASYADSADAEPSIRVQEKVSKQLADVALIVVHGMGRQRQAETLLEWAEPILGRIDWLTKRAADAHLDRASAERDELGVTVLDAVMAGDGAPSVLVNARWRVHGGGTAERRIAIVEARWSESFVPMTRSDVFSWGARFLWRSLIRIFLHFAATMVGVPWVALKARRSGSVGRMLLAIPGLLVGAALVIVSAGVILLLGIALTVLLPLLSPLMLIPVVKRGVQTIIDVLVDFVGDVGTYRQKPLRAAAMRMVFFASMGQARAMIREDGEVAVLAHSQGAAIAAAALFHELDLEDSRVTRFTTVGAAITLLGKTMWELGSRSEDYTPIANWVTRAPHVRWDNYWAIWDPFAAGPIGDTYWARQRRWERCYNERAVSSVRAGSADCPYFPAEHAVHNTSMPFTDHQSYARNTAQVVEPIALELLGPDFIGPRDVDRQRRDKRVVGIRRARGIMLIAAIIIAVLLPGQAWFTALVVGGIEWLKSLILATLNAMNWHPTLDASAFYSSTEASLTSLGLALTIVLVAAGLIWLSGFVAGHAERQIVWGRGATAGLYRYFPLELLFQAAMVGAAAALVAITGAGWWGPVVPILAWVAVPLTLLSIHGGAVPVSAPANNPPGP